MWSTIEIGVGFMVSALGGFGVLENAQVNWALLIIGIILIIHGFFELYIKPKVFLKHLIKHWLIRRKWKILTLEGKEYKDYYFALVAESQQQYRVSITRSKEHRGVLIFHMTLPIDSERDSNFKKFTNKQQNQLIEEIRLFLTTKDMPFENIKWPLDKVLIERVLPISSSLSEQVVDDKAKEIVFTSLGINTIIRKSLALLKIDIEDSQTE